MEARPRSIPSPFLECTLVFKTNSLRLCLSHLTSTPSVKAESSDFFTTISRIRRYQVDQTRDDAPVWGTSSTADRYFAEAVNDGG
jgi:hypothetical protein